MFKDNLSTHYNMCTWHCKLHRVWPLTCSLRARRWTRALNDLCSASLELAISSSVAWGMWYRVMVCVCERSSEPTDRVASLQHNLFSDIRRSISLLCVCVCVRGGVMHTVQMKVLNIIIIGRQGSLRCHDNITHFLTVLLSTICSWPSFSSTSLKYCNHGNRYIFIHEERRT